MRMIKSMEEKYLFSSLDMVEAAFTDWADAQEGQLVRSLVEEIRGMNTYIPELELIMVDETDAPVNSAASATCVRRFSHTLPGF